MSRELLLDWRGVPNLTKACDLYSVANTHLVRPTIGNPKGRVLVAFSPMVLFHLDEVASNLPQTFNHQLYQAALDRNAMTDLVVWQGSAGWHTRLIDITKRRMVQDMVRLATTCFPWAEGFHLDYFTTMSWQFPELEPKNEQWDAALADLAQSLRAAGKLALGQQFQIKGPATSLNGEYWEQSPTSFGYSLGQHATEKQNFVDLLAFVKDTREVLFVSEIRSPFNYPAWYLSGVKSWADQYDIVLSWGRDSTAGVIP